MRQKVNPTIFSLNNTNKWKFKYFEKKPTEYALLGFKNVEIHEFIKKFFAHHGFLINDLKLHYFNSRLTIFISYFSTLDTFSRISSENKAQKIKLIGKKLKNLKLGKKTVNYNKYRQYNYVKKLNNRFLHKHEYKKHCLEVATHRLVYNLKRAKSIQIYKTYTFLKQNNQINKIQFNSFLTNFFNIITKFIGYKYNISLILNRVNTDLKQKTTKIKFKTLKKSLVKLRKYEQNNFFLKSLTVLFLSSNELITAKLLAYFIVSQLNKLKKHNLFLRFLKNALALFYNKEKLNGIKIKIKGRFNGAPRSRHRILTIGNGVAAQTINSNLDYYESTAFTANGTFGVKVWISKKLS